MSPVSPPAVSTDQIVKETPKAIRLTKSTKPISGMSSWSSNSKSTQMETFTELFYKRKMMSTRVLIQVLEVAINVNNPLIHQILLKVNTRSY